MHPTRPLTLLTALALAGAASAASHEIESTFRSAKPQAVEYENLLGRIEVLPATGKELVLEFKVVAGGSDDAAARRLAELIQIKTSETDGRVTVQVQYPLDEHRTYAYGIDRGSHETNTEYQGRRVRISSRARDAADVHVDLVAYVPPRMRARFDNAVGEISARDIEGDLSFDTGSGNITTRATSGRLRGDTGSGSITVHGHRGEVEADTGSGDVEVEQVVGEIDADTGSGSVTIRDSKARMKADTGSGRIVVLDSTGDLDADTGSGGVEARGFTAGERLRADTGSGGVRLEGDLSALRDLVIDTGSGGATLRTSKPLDLRLEIDTGSGGIRVDVPNMTDVEQDDGEFSATLGRGTGRAVISTGSGGARVEQTR